ncbi:MAG: exonuclease [Armatimonadetes bacterium]|nr:exonuclease [Armatimonadota bacterium]
MVRITCYDGVGCIGGNKILLEDGDRRLFFDFGRNFGAEGAFYEEFVQPKTISGLYEHVQMGFLPPFRDLYRRDMVPEMCDPWDGIDALKAGEVGGVLVSHAHVDHIGSLHYLRTDIPIYCSSMTAAVSRALQDTGASPTQAEYCYYVYRAEKDGGCLGVPHYKTHPYAGRKYHITDMPCSLPFEAFWDCTPDSRELEALVCEPVSTCAGMRVMSFPVDHSVYGATAWAVETEAGWVVYSGDLRTHGGYGDYTRRFAEEAAKLNPIALIIEGTRITSESDYTEGSVRDACMEVVKRTEGLVVADFGPRNVERLISFLEVAKQTGRELAILPKDAYLLDTMRKAGGVQTVPPLDGSGMRIYWEYAGSSNKWRDQIREAYPHLGVTPQDVAANQDKYICCFSFWDVNELAYLKPVPGSVWIYSSCEAFSEEMRMSSERLQEWINHFGMQRYGRLFDSEPHDDPFHVSGHASGPDLLRIVETIRPKTLIPVHSVHPEIYAERLGDMCRVVMPEKGVAVEV